MDFPLYLIPLSQLADVEAERSERAGRDHKRVADLDRIRASKDSEPLSLPKHLREDLDFAADVALAVGLILGSQRDVDVIQRVTGVLSAIEKKEDATNEHAAEPLR